MEKAVSIGTWAVAMGLPTHVGVVPPVTGSPLVVQGADPDGQGPVGRLLHRRAGPESRSAEAGGRAQGAAGRTGDRDDTARSQTSYPTLPRRALARDHAQDDCVLRGARASGSSRRTTRSASGTRTSSSSNVQRTALRHPAHAPPYGGRMRAGTPGATASSTKSSAFYGLAYWYTWQVSILGLGPVWMSHERGRQAQGRAIAARRRGVRVRPLGAGARRGRLLDRDDADPAARRHYLANGEKYYIGNGNTRPWSPPSARSRARASTSSSVADYRHRNYDLIGNVTDSQNYVADFALRDYPVTEATSSRAAMPPGTPRSTRSTSASTTWAGRPSASARTRCTRRSTTPRAAACTAWP